MAVSELLCGMWRTTPAAYKGTRRQLALIVGTVAEGCMEHDSEQAQARGLTSATPRIRSRDYYRIMINLEAPCFVFGLDPVAALAAVCSESETITNVAGRNQLHNKGVRLLAFCHSRE